MDGAVELRDGPRLAVEIKFRMNWLKACQAEWQFRNFVKRHGKVAGPVDGGIVFFEAFSGDWGKPAPSRLLQNGWNHWYRGHSEVDEIQVSLVRFCNGGLQTFHDAIIADLGNLTADQASVVFARLAAQGSQFDLGGVLWTKL